MAERCYDFDVKRSSRACESDCFYHFAHELNHRAYRFEHMSSEDDRTGNTSKEVRFDNKTSVGIVMLNGNDYPKAPRVSIHASSERKAEKERRILTRLTGIVLTDKRFH